MSDKESRSCWKIYAKKADFNAIADRFGIDPVTARILRNRDIITESEIDKYLNGTINDLYSPHDLIDLDKAVELIATAIDAGAKIRVVGDYDIDGICSTYILLKGFSRCGADVDYRIPERVRDGYGINDAIILQAVEDKTDLLVTCDNGISAYQQAVLAADKDLPVIVTDHHEVLLDADGNEILPPALAVVDPYRKGCIYPFKDISGAVVAYKLIQVLYERYGIPKEEWIAMIEFAAVATVGDIMPLRDENRILVKEGLKRMPYTKSLGLRALIGACGVDIAHVTAHQIGFVIGPCLNAGGRLETAEMVLKLLLCDNNEEAYNMAGHLQQLNEERKSLTDKGTKEAFAQIEEKYADDMVLVVYLPDCHESLAGIIAGRVRETYNKPALVLTPSEGCVKGSGRSVPAYNMFLKLSEVKHLLSKFGGHPMAAGFSIDEENIDAFRKSLNENSGLTAEDLTPVLWIDAAMPLDYITEKLVGELDLLEPCGQGNEKPQFALKGLRIRDVHVKGKTHNTVRLDLITESGSVMEGVLFTDADAFVKELGNRRRIDIVYYPDINEYNGNRKLQVRISEYRIPEY